MDVETTEARGGRVRECESGPFAVSGRLWLDPGLPSRSGTLNWNVEGKERKD
jgi:hypothetical protein